MKPLPLDDAGRADIAHELEALVPRLHDLVDGQPPDRAYSYQQVAEAIAADLRAAAERGEGYAEARAALQDHRRLSARLDAKLDELLASLERLEQDRLRRERYSPRWWDQTLRDLEQAYRETLDGGYAQWLRVFAEALVDWQLETCSRLANTTFTHPRDKVPYALLIRHGTAALQAQEYPATLEMIKYLVSQMSEPADSGARLLGALLAILIGRIQLLHLHEPEAAGQSFERAAALAPGDGRPLIAQGHMHLAARDEAGIAEAKRLFSRGIELSPNEPEGYVGNALIAEKREAWTEADEWHKLAVQEASDEPDPFLYLSKLLAPSSGRLFLHLARRLLDDHALERALAAVEQCLALGLEDGGSYPTRTALALKADILLAADRAGLPAADDQTIADLYFQAGRYHYWSDEIKPAVDALTRCCDLDERNALARFYHADSLRILSQVAAPPYVDEALARLSLETWEAGLQRLSERVDSDLAWVYVARSSISDQLARLPQEDAVEHAWQSLVFMERALLLKESADWWARLGNVYNANGLGLYANMLHVMQKALSAQPDDTFTLQEYAKVLINTGELEPAQATLDKLLASDKVDDNVKADYQSWQAVVDYYRGDYREALAHLAVMMEQRRDDFWGLTVRANVYRALGNEAKALDDEQKIWNLRDDPLYQQTVAEFAWAAFRLGRYAEGLERIQPMRMAVAVEQRVNAETLIGLCHLALGDFPAADEHLSLALDQCDNPRLLADLVIELEQFEHHAARAEGTLNPAQARFLNQRGGLLERARARQKKMKQFQADPIKELEAILADLTPEQAGATRWIAAQFGLGRLHLEAGHHAAAASAYRALLQLRPPIPEAQTGLEKAEAADGSRQ
jgi:Tfp pilus assembly protein PilF